MQRRIPGNRGVGRMSLVGRLPGRDIPHGLWQGFMLLLDRLSAWQTQEGGKEEWQDKLRSAGILHDSKARQMERVQKKEFRKLTVLTERLLETIRPRQPADGMIYR